MTITTAQYDRIDSMLELNEHKSYISTHAAIADIFNINIFAAMDLQIAYENAASVSINN